MAYLVGCAQPRRYKIGCPSHLSDWSLYSLPCSIAQTPLLLVPPEEFRKEGMLQHVLLAILLGE